MSNRLELEALDVRRNAVHKEGLTGIDALVAIIFPSPAVRDASMIVAAENLEKKARKQQVKLNELYDDLPSPAAQRA